QRRSAYGLCIVAFGRSSRGPNNGRTTQSLCLRKRSRSMRRTPRTMTSTDSIMPPPTPDLPQIIVADSMPPRRRRREFAEKPPRFSLAHVFLWVTFNAVLMALVRTQIKQEVGVVGLAITVAVSVLVAAGWSLAAILIYRWWQDAPWPSEPGHWLGAA